jgi:hypothetical protein
LSSSPLGIGMSSLVIVLIGVQKLLWRCRNIAWTRNCVSRYPGRLIGLLAGIQGTRPHRLSADKQGHQNLIAHLAAPVTVHRGVKHCAFWQCVG